MPATIDATPGGVNANSYATLAEANTYWDASPYSATWDDADDDAKTRALITATKMLDSWYDWQGAISRLNQALLWPRAGVLRPGVAQGAVPDAITNDWREPFGVLLDQTLIPVLIRDATCELAGALLAGNRQADSDLETQALRSLTAGPVSLSFGSGASAKPIPDAVMIMASQLGTLRSKAGSGPVNMMRG